MEQIQQWGVFEVELQGPASGNPFVEVDVAATFRTGHRSVAVRGFYDGEGTYRIRFMPDQPGEWTYETKSAAAELHGKRGALLCTPATPPNRGPVNVTNTWHFAYADGTQHLPMGTTCYAWVHQTDALEKATLEQLGRAPFNKLRMCVFPKDYIFNRNEPVHHPFERSPAGWDFSRFNPAFFRHLEQRVRELLDLGIEADLILFHPYDRWGYATLGAEADDRYLRYLVARLAAFRNVWWSLANEFDLMKKTTADWDRLFRIVQTEDPYGHPRSIHNCHGFYDHTRPWVTHASVQHSDLSRVTEWRRAYGKPIVVDECCYEGDIQLNWGNITAQEMVHRVWEGTTRGGWVGHGETYLDPDEVLWWSKGGKLRGKSPERIAYLRALLSKAPPWLQYTDRLTRAYPTLCAGDDYFLLYIGNRQPARVDLSLPEGRSYRVEVIDTWEMTATTLPFAAAGTAAVALPGRPYMALRLTAIDR